VFKVGGSIVNSRVGKTGEYVSNWAPATGGHPFLKLTVHGQIQGYSRPRIFATDFVGRLPAYQPNSIAEKVPSRNPPHIADHPP